MLQILGFLKSKNALTRKISKQDGLTLRKERRALGDEGALFLFNNDGLITIFLVENKRSLSKLVKNVYKTHTSSILKNGSGVLHARYESPDIIKRLLRGLAVKDVDN